MSVLSYESGWSDCHYLSSELLLGDVALVAVPCPLVHLADSKAKAGSDHRDTCLWEVLVLLPFLEETCFLLDGFRVVGAFLLFEKH